MTGALERAEQRAELVAVRRDDWLRGNPNDRAVSHSVDDSGTHVIQLHEGGVVISPKKPGALVGCSIGKTYTAALSKALGEVGA